MGFIKAIGSLVSRNAWTEQYIENFHEFVKQAEHEQPEFPRCALLALAWTGQFTLPFCPVPSCQNIPLIATTLASFYSCLDKPCDSEALAFHAVLEAKLEKAYAKAMLNRGGMKISDIIGEKFGGRYKSLTRQIFDDLANRNYSALKQKFAARNPKGARYFVDLPITEQMIIKKLPDSDESSEGKALVFSENHMLTQV